MTNKISDALIQTRDCSLVSIPNNRPKIAGAMDAFAPRIPPVSAEWQKPQSTKNRPRAYAGAWSRHTSSIKQSGCRADKLQRQCSVQELSLIQPHNHSFHNS